MKQVKKAFFVFEAVHVFTETELEKLKAEFPKFKAEKTTYYVSGFTASDLILTENKKEAMRFNEENSVKLIHSKGWVISSYNWKRVRV